jgi:hypothetical protein
VSSWVLDYAIDYPYSLHRSHSSIRYSWSRARHLQVLRLCVLCSFGCSALCVGRANPPPPPPPPPPQYMSRRALASPRPRAPARVRAEGLPSHLQACAARSISYPVPITQASLAPRCSSTSCSRLQSRTTCHPRRVARGGRITHFCEGPAPPPPNTANLCVPPPCLVLETPNTVVRPCCEGLKRVPSSSASTNRRLTMASSAGRHCVPVHRLGLSCTSLCTGHRAICTGHLAIYALPVIGHLMGVYYFYGLRSEVGPEIIYE